MRGFFFAALLCLLVAVRADWINDKKLRDDTDQKHPVVAKEYVVNLDLPQKERWKHIGEEYADRAWMLVNYLRTNLPRGWLKPLEEIASHMIDFFADYGEEMEGYAKALNITTGDVVMINLVYQLERLGLHCDSWNTTGPVNPRLCDEDGFGYLQIEENEDKPGQCTSFVASTPEGKIYHGRNLDWNLQDSLKQFVINVEYTRSSKAVYHATTVVGFVGIIHAVKPGAFAWSLDARRKGGKILPNALSALFQEGVRTPEQHARYVFETVDTYDEAVTALGNTPIVNPVYYIVSGTKYPQGAVLARDRKGVVNSYLMEDRIHTPGVGIQEDFWVGVTNYDLNVPVPPADDRSTPLYSNMNALKGQSFDDSTLWNILKQWPTMNPHTDITAVIDVKQGTFAVTVWMDHGPKE